jgi:acyl-CoA thioesterase-1
MSFFGVRISILTLILALVVLLLPAAANSLRIVALGDSLTAGYGLPQGKGFPGQLEAALRDKGYAVEVINSGISGDTTAGGLARLDWSLQERPDLVIVELGANDALRGFPPATTRKNLEAIIARIKAAQSDVLLAGIYAPRNLGPAYYTEFDRIYPDLAQQHEIYFYPFFLQGVAGKAEFNLADGIHPNEQGVAVIVDNILPLVERALKVSSPP